MKFHIGDEVWLFLQTPDGEKTYRDGQNHGKYKYVITGLDSWTGVTYFIIERSDGERVGVSVSNNSKFCRMELSPDYIKMKRNKKLEELL